MRRGAEGDEYVSNCLLFSLRKLATCGGRVVVRKSKIWWGPHFMWQPPDGSSVWQFVPLNPEGKWFLVFKGRVMRGDPPHDLVQESEE